MDRKAVVAEAGRLLKAGEQQAALDLLLTELATEGTENTERPER